MTGTAKPMVQLTKTSTKKYRSIVTAIIDVTDGYSADFAADALLLALIEHIEASVVRPYRAEVSREIAAALKSHFESEKN